MVASIPSVRPVRSLSQACGGAVISLAASPLRVGISSVHVRTASITVAVLAEAALNCGHPPGRIGRRGGVSSPRGVFEVSLSWN